jgi:hypothetical protein
MKIRYTWMPGSKVYKVECDGLVTIGGLGESIQVVLGKFVYEHRDKLGLEFESIQIPPTSTMFPGK